MVGNPYVTRPNHQRRVRCGCPSLGNRNFLQVSVSEAPCAESMQLRTESRAPDTAVRLMRTNLQEADLGPVTLIVAESGVVGCGLEQSSGIPTLLVLAEVLQQHYVADHHVDLLIQEDLSIFRC